MVHAGHKDLPSRLPNCHLEKSFRNTRRSAPPQKTPTQSFQGKILKAILWLVAPPSLILQAFCHRAFAQASPTSTSPRLSLSVSLSLKRHTHAYHLFFPGRVTFPTAFLAHFCVVGLPGPFRAGIWSHSKPSPGQAVLPNFERNS